MKDDFEALLTQYAPLLSRVASGYEANENLRDELVQDIALAVWQSLQRFEGRSNLKTYILKVAHNRAVSHVARQVRQPATDLFNDEMHTCGAADAVSRQLEQEQATERLLRAIRRLPVQSRQIVILSLEDLSYEEISDVCGLSVNHIGVTLNRARAALKKELTNE